MSDSREAEYSFLTANETNPCLEQGDLRVPKKKWLYV